MLLLLVGRAIPRLNALPRGTYDSRVLILTFIRNTLFGLGAYLDNIINGSLRAKGGIQAAHWFPGVGIFDPNLLAQDVLSLSPAVTFAAGTWVGMHTLHDDVRFRHRLLLSLRFPAALG